MQTEEQKMGEAWEQGYTFVLRLASIVLTIVTIFSCIIALWLHCKKSVAMQTISNANPKFLIWKSKLAVLVMVIHLIR